MNAGGRAADRADCWSFSSFGVAVLLTRRLIGYAKRRRMMDHPDDRRLHRRPRPVAADWPSSLRFSSMCLPLAYGSGDHM
jgi:hypothetical protein